MKFINKINLFFTNLFDKDEKYVLINSIIIFLPVIFIWEEFLLKFITLLSFVTAAISYSLRDTIINFFTGIYIKVSKPFSIED